MKIALFFVLIVNTGCDDADVVGCTGGWFEFRCTYSNGKGHNVKVYYPGKPELSLTYLVENRWRDLDSYGSVYHNTTGRYWRVLVKNLTHKDFGEYECKWKNREKEIVLNKGNKACATSLRSVYRGSQTTIRCAQGTFICKENPKGPECDVLPWGPVYSLSAASEQDQGTYWCGQETAWVRVARQQIQLRVVNVTQYRLRLSPGQNSSYSCPYPDGVPLQKFVCKGDDSTACPQLSGRFSLQDVPENQSVIVTVRGVTEEDSGWYWVGAKSSDRNEKHFFHKLFLLVESENVTTLPNKNDTDSIHPTPSSQPHKQDELWKSIVVGVVVGAVLLLLAIALFGLHRRRCCFPMVPTANKEEHHYDEIQERPLQVGAAAVNTIYSTATLDTVKPESDKNKPSAEDGFKDNILYMQQYS